MRRLLAICVIFLLLSGEAYTSGSSTVSATGPSLKVSLSSPSMIFAESDQEYHWHSDWKIRSQPEVDAAIQAISPVLDRYRLPLAPWSEDLPVAWSFAEPGSAQDPVVVCGSCRLLLEPGRSMFEVEVALSAPVDRFIVKKLEVAIARALGVEPTIGVFAELKSAKKLKVQGWGFTAESMVWVNADVTIPHASVACMEHFSREVKTDAEGALEVILRGGDGCQFSGPDWWTVQLSQGEFKVETPPFEGQ
jgi:hypothetical protein